MKACCLLRERLLEDTKNLKREITFCLDMAKNSHNTLMVNKLTEILIKIDDSGN
jgi:hypothetical protein